MIKQSAIGLNSRSEANPYKENGFLPLITAPMYSVVDENNYQVFLDNKIQVCLPRDVGDMSDEYFVSLSLKDFIQYFIELEEDIIPDKKYKVCIDTANGNMPALHDAIRKAKEIHGNNLIIIAGNVASVEAFIELAKTGVDYIRVGIGGGGCCNTTSNTGVGQEDLYVLIHQCNYLRGDFSKSEFKNGLHNYPFFGTIRRSDYTEQELKNIHNVKIVADGISTYIKQCETKYGFNDNGYAAINKLLFAGADLVMIGKLFAQCLESAGDKTSQMRYDSGENWIARGKAIGEIWNNDDDQLIVKYSGMSTQEEQKKYRIDIQQLEIIDGPTLTTNSNYEYTIKKIGEPFKNIKPSEGSVQWIPVRWTLSEWLNGSKNQDQYPYLMGWTNSIKSAMAYTGKTTL